jgi:hypothetical protein
MERPWGQTSVSTTKKKKKRRKFITMSAYIKNISNKWCNDAFKVLEKQEQAKPKISRWKEILRSGWKWRLKEHCKESTKQRVLSFKESNWWI